MKLFISYRRSDSTHAAHRVRMSLQAKFGADAVFIDREIPAGRKWQEHLEKRLAECTGIVVMVGDEFLNRLKRHTEAPEEEVDPLLWEIATAIRLGKPIYPVLFGAIDMPDEARLPESIRDFARYQAVFAREPAFDTAMSVLIKSIAEQEGWIDDSITQDAPQGAHRPSPQLSNQFFVALPLLALALLLIWWSGRLLLWLAHPDQIGGRTDEAAIWHGVRYVLATGLWGLGPYLAYWLVAGLRARARLPIFNLHGILTTVNVGVMLVSGGTFLLLSTLSGWRMRPLWVFPEQPSPLHYALLAFCLAAILMLAVSVAILEPQVRALAPTSRARIMRVVHVCSATLLIGEAWFAASLVNSLPSLGLHDPVPIVGFVMLCPLLSVLVAGWQYSESLLGPRERAWQLRCLLAFLVTLYWACTLALFAFGPTRLLVPAL